MNDEVKKNFKAELKALLTKYNADIGFTCSDGSDTYGIYEAAIEVQINNKTVVKTSGYWLDKSDL